MWQSIIGNYAIKSLHLFLYKTMYFYVVHPTNKLESDLSPRSVICFSPLSLSNVGMISLLSYPIQV